MATPCACTLCTLLCLCGLCARVFGVCARVFGCVDLHGCERGVGTVQRPVNEHMQECT